MHNEFWYSIVENGSLLYQYFNMVDSMLKIWQQLVGGGGGERKGRNPLKNKSKALYMYTECKAKVNLR